MKVLVGMSGGVDSSVTACLLKEEGHEVIGATMSIWDKNKHYKITTHKDACFSPHEEEDIKEARAICDKLEIPYYVIDCTKQYQKLVLDNFKQEYLAGRTPNPCVRCNATIKFETLPRSAAEQGIEFDKFATGHYARLSYNLTVISCVRLLIAKKIKAIFCTVCNKSNYQKSCYRWENIPKRKFVISRVNMV